MATRQIPARMRVIMVKKLSSNFKEATSIEEVDVPKPGPKPGPKQVLVKHKYVGVNATDIYYTTGGYCPDRPPPYAAGLEALGEIVETGPEACMNIGQTVIFINAGSYSEYSAVDETACVPVPSADPAFLSLVLSGVTASLAFETKGELKRGETVLVTAAAGGTGQFAVQLAKLAGCHVIGTCSSPKKAEFLKSLGCDRVINYNTENFAEVIPKEYPKGIDVVYECVGGEIYDACITNLATRGRLIIIGHISSYEGQETRGGFQDPKRKNAVWHDFEEGKLKIFMDHGPEGKPFKGIEAVYDAVEYMYTKKNMGKIVVALDES